MVQPSSLDTSHFRLKFPVEDLGFVAVLIS